MNQADMNQANVDQSIRENLSAGIDGELSKEELRFLLRRLDHDVSLQQAWAHYHIARDGLRRQLPLMAAPGFAARVMLAIEQESMPAIANNSSSGRRSRHWLRWSAGGAIAASVAAAALMISQPTNDTALRAGTSAPRAAASALARVAPESKQAIPAAVPPWLSGDSAGLLSQQASATLGAPLDESQPIYARRQLGDTSLHRYRTLSNNDGSYLLLLDPSPKVAPATSRQAVAQ
jgi:sigma-E factor negative regulatory protein RseA